MFVGDVIRNGIKQQVKYKKNYPYSKQRMVMITLKRGFGHFGRSSATFPWERTDRTESLRDAL